MKKGIEEIFLFYANNSFRNNPKNISKFIKHSAKILPEFNQDDTEYDTKLESYIKIAGYVVDIVKHYDNSKLSKTDMNQYLKSYLIAEVDNLDVCYKAIAFNAAYAFRQNGGNCLACSDETRIARRKLLGDNLFGGKTRIKCYECDQLCIINIVRDIIKGKEYDDIENFDDFIHIKNHNIKTQIQTRFDIFNQKGPFRTRLNKIETHYLNIPVGIEGGDNQNALRKYLITIGMHSLIEFLIHDDRRKLKHCPFCKSYFIAQNIRREKCYSEKCNREYQRHEKQKQRRDDPVKYI